MLNQKLDFSFSESSIYNKSYFFSLLQVLIPTVVFLHESNYWKSIARFSN